MLIYQKVFIFGNGYNYEEMMEVRKANIDDADTIGYIHSTAWKQTYTGVFTKEYLNEDTAEKRKQEFLESCTCEDVSYYIILEKYRNKGYGRQVICHLKKDIKRMQLWVLKDNIEARNFYENVYHSGNNYRRRCIRTPHYFLQLHRFFCLRRIKWSFRSTRKGK